MVAFCDAEMSTYHYGLFLCGLLEKGEGYRNRVYELCLIIKSLGVLIYETRGTVEYH